jgi:hypothetical protein
VLVDRKTTSTFWSAAVSALLCLSLLLTACGADATPGGKRPAEEAPGGSASAPGRQPVPEPELEPEPTPEPTPEPEEDPMTETDPEPDAPVSPAPLVISARDLFVQPGQGQLAMTLHPAPQVAGQGDILVEAVIPLPRGVLMSAEYLRVLDQQGMEIPSSAEVLLYWNDAGHGLELGVRSVRVHFLWSFSSAEPLALWLDIGERRRLTLEEAPQQLWLAAAQSDFFPEEYAATEQILEPAVHVTLPADWLGASLLRTRSSPRRDDARWALLDQSLPEFAKTAVNDVPEHVTPENLINYETDYEPWLFDRASTLWTVYIRTGDVKWLRHANRATQFYRNRIGTGYFDMRPGDLKYAYNLPLLMGYALTGDASMLAPIRRVADVAANDWFQPVYRSSLNFWTERHLAYSIHASLIAWEATGEAGYLERVNGIIAGNQLAFENRNGGWSGGCVLHTVLQHEGGGLDSDRVICSPWMAALYGEVLWRHYLVTGDVAGLQQLALLGDFLAQQATYVSTETNVNLNGRTFPYYLKGPLYDSKTYGVADEWSDREHACDVAGFVYRSAYSRQLLGQSAAAQVELADRLMDTCLWNIAQWIRTGADTVAAGKTFYRLTPPRKFNWWFGTTSDLAWLAEVVR